MSTVRVTLEAAGDLPESVREALQALVTAATEGGISVEFSYKPSLHTAVTVGGHEFNVPEMSTERRSKEVKAMLADMTYAGR